MVFFCGRRDTALEIPALRQQSASLKRKRPRPQQACLPEPLECHTKQHAGVTRVLSAVMRRPVIDQTGIKGTFDVRLHWSDA